MSDANGAKELHPIVRARWAILVVFLGLCAWLIPGVTNIQNDDDVLAFLPPDHAEVINVSTRLPTATA